MKKLVLISFVFTITTVSLSAQTDYGIRAGFFNSKRNTNIRFGNDGLRDGRNYNEGVYLGGFIGFKLSEKFSLQPEINYAYVKNDFDQLHIPVLGRYRIGKKFTVFLGPNFGFLLTDNENFNKINFGATIGVSYEITKKLLIEARHYAVFTESLKDRSLGSFNPTTKFNNFQVGLVYRLD